MHSGEKLGQAMRQSSDYDAVFIGSGINSLVGAALLAHEGWQVCVLERNDYLGGAIRTAEITTKGFLHEVFSCWHPLFFISEAYAALGSELQQQGLSYASSDLVTATLYPDGQSVIMQRSLERTMNELERCALGDGRAWQQDLNDFERASSIGFKLLSAELASPAGAMLALRAGLQFHGIRGVIAYAASLLQTSRDWLQETFSSPKTRGLFSPWVLHTGVGPDAASSGFMNRAIAAVLQNTGLPVPLGGGSKLVDALVQVITDHHGACVTNSEVQQIIVSGGRALGVRLNNKDIITAKRAVVCNVTPPDLYGRLLSETTVPQHLQTEAKRFRFSTRAGMQVHYALSREPQWEGDERLAKVPVIHLTPGLDGVSRAVNQAERGLLPAIPTIVCGQPAAVDPTRVPAGNSMLWIQLQEVPSIPQGDGRDEIDTNNGVWTESLRERYADRIQAILSMHIKDFESSIISRVAFSPADIEASNPNLRGGDIYSGSCALDQNFIWRPRPRLTGHKTFIKSLYHIGASTHPGPGLGAGSGIIIAKELLGKKQL